MQSVFLLISAAAVMFIVIGGLSLLAHYYTLNGIKSCTVGDGQHGTARFATKQEVKSTYQHIPFQSSQWRKGENLPSTKQQGLILGSVGAKNKVTALVDTDDVHCPLFNDRCIRRGQDRIFSVPEPRICLCQRNVLFDN